MSYEDTRHEPVLLKEILENLAIRADGIYCDATLGGGEFTRQFLSRLPRGMVIAFDRDPLAIANTRARIGGDKRLVLINANFDTMQEQWRHHKWPRPDGIVYDLGQNSVQIADPERGFGFMHESSPLDMRFDPNESTLTAADILATFSQAELESLFRDHGEQAARRVARRIVRERTASPIITTGRLAGLVASTAGKKKQRGTRPQKSSLR